MVDKLTDQEVKDNAVKEAGEILIKAFAKPDKAGFYGSVTFNLQGNRQTVHGNVNHEVVVQFSESKQFAG